MNWIVGDHAIWANIKRRRKVFYLVKIIEITDLMDVNGQPDELIKIKTIKNAETGKKYTTTKILKNYHQLKSLETYLDEKRLLIKDLEQYL